MTTRVGQQRQRVLELVRSAREPLDAQHLADSLGVHVSTIRFHLNVLEEEGHVVRRGGDREPRAGRPRVTYAAAPRLDYADVVSLFAVHLGGTAAEREQRAVLIGADLAHRVGVARARNLPGVADLVSETLAEMGFRVLSTLTSFGRTSVQVCSCPLSDIASSAPEVVRGIQQGLIQEVLDVNAETIGGAVHVAVTPDADHGKCVVRIELSGMSRTTAQHV